MKEKISAWIFALSLAVFVVGAATDLVRPAAAEENRPPTVSLELLRDAWTGDFDSMLENRRIRILVPYSRTLCFNDRGLLRGLTADAVHEFERYLNRKYAGALNRRPLTVFLVPTPRDRLLSDVAAGLGDIAAGDITVTEERLKTVDFVAPAVLPGTAEILVHQAASPEIRTLDDLSGKTVHVRPATSYAESLSSLNKRFEREGKNPVDIVAVPDTLEDEDLLEMLNAGIFDFLVVDDWMAEIWEDILPAVRVRRDIVLRSGGATGWAIRKESPKLAEEIRGFCRHFQRTQGEAARRLARYHRQIARIEDPTRTPEWKRFKETLSLFEKYGGQYGFDPIMLAAQGYQESGLDQRRRSRAGAIGIMQVMPATGKAMKVGDIRVAEHNIHAGVKYLDQLVAGYFADVRFSDQDRSLFAFAGYNAGPGKIAAMRKLAEKRGLDPDQWFNNVERVVAQHIGFETVAYVRNIFKYFVAYKLTMKLAADKARIRDDLATGHSRNRK
ncbi:MAG: transporter substrate-binding domain-containing protein [Deltaproteobacteria bacterium]|nr:transporter substrate-binding domain-containing protein [Deltaproteobacteria bacterium]